MCDTSNNLTPAKENTVMYYIEGTIDAIEVIDGTLRFSLLPANEFLQELDNVKKFGVIGKSQIYSHFL